MEQEGPEQQWIREIRRLLIEDRVDEALDTSLEFLKKIKRPPSETGDLSGEMLLDLYDSFYVKPVEDFHRRAEEILPHEAFQEIKDHLEESIRLTREWNKKLENMYLERQAREIHMAIRSRHYDDAVDRCENLFNTEDTPEGKRRVAAMIGNIFGTLENEQPGVKEVFKRLYAHSDALGLSTEIYKIIEKNQKERLALIYKSNLSRRSVEWNRALSSASADIRKYLPSSTQFKGLDEEDRRRLDRMVRSVIRCYHKPPHEGVWEDIVLLLVELCPKETTGAGAAAGVESRLYNTLTPTQKKTVINVLTRLGQNDHFVQQMISFAKENHGNRYQEYAIEFLGGMKADQSTDYLLECMKNRSLQGTRMTAAYSLGSMATPLARENLLSNLKSLMSYRTVTAARRTEAETYLMALAKISRNKKITQKERNDLMREIIEILDENDQRLNVVFGENFFLVRRDEINPAFKKWAAEQLTKGLWMKETEAEFARGPEGGETSRRTNLGWRERMVNALEKLGTEYIPTMIETAERYLIHYSPAYMAIGEVMGRIGDKRAVPLIDKLLTATLLTEEKDIPEYDRETYWNAATEKRETLDKDQIASTLVFALNRIGGEESDKLLAEYYEKFQAGQFSIPGTGTSDLLYKAYQRIKETRPEIMQEGEEEKGEEESKISADKIKKAMKALKKHYWFSGRKKKHLKKVSAFQTLGKAASIKAVPLILDHLDNGDSIISSAALSALAEYNVPPMSAEKLNAFLSPLMKKYHNAHPHIRRKIETVIEKLHPERKDMRKRIKKAVEIERDPQTRFTMEKLFEGVIAPGQEKKTGEQPEDERKSEKAKEGGLKPLSVQRLEQKRAFMQARKKWIEEGKPGDAPKMEDYIK